MNDVLHDPAVCKLGRSAAKPPRLMLANYVDLEKLLPQLPATVNSSLGQSIQLAMYLNDKIGDCTCAAIGNSLRVLSRGEVQLADADVEKAYEDVTAKENPGNGFNPQTGQGDSGAVELDVLDYWQATGVGGHKIVGHGGVNMKDLNEVHLFCWLFGFVYLGLNLATEQQQQAVWDFVPGSTPGSWGGHAVPLFDVNPNYVGTWGAYKRVTDTFLTNQAEEGHVVITAEWIAAQQQNQDVINLKALTADLGYTQQES